MPDDRLVALKQKLEKRRGMPGYEDNVRELEREIERLENRS